MAQTVSETRPLGRAGRWRGGGLAGRLARAFVLLAGVTILVVGLALTLVSYNALLEQIIVRQQKTAGEAAVVTSAYLNQAQDTLHSFGQVAGLGSLLLLSMDSQQGELRDFMNSYPDMLLELTVLDADGEEMAKVSQFYTFLVDELVSQAGNPAFQQALQGEPFVGNSTRMPSYSSFPAVLMAVPVEGRDRRGVLIAEVSIKGMWDAMASVEVGETGYAYIVDRNTGQLIAHSSLPRYLAFQDQSLEDVSIVRQLMAGEMDIQPRYEGLEGEDVIGAATSLPGTEWVMVVELPTQEALAGVRGMLYLLAILIVVGVVAAAGLGLAIPRRIIRPLSVLREGAEEIGEGRLDHVIEVHTGDELEDLADAFNQMASSLAASRLELERWGRELEVRVEERTHELAEASGRMERRAAQLQISAEVAHAITSVRELDALLLEMTRLISERFGWYHVGVFLVDEAGEYAVLRAANSEGGQRMLARGHRLKVGEVGIVGSVTGSGRPRIALDVGEDAVYFDTPELHGTRSEMALPLKVGDQIIGALDVQSTESAAYDEEDVALLSTLADQVAVAIQNSRLFEQTQRAFEEVQSLHRKYVQREWAGVSAKQRDLVYEYRRAGAPAEAETLPSELAAALTSGELVVWPQPGRMGEGPFEGGTSPDDNGHPLATLAAPIKFRDQVIGALDLQETDGPRQWTEDEINIVQSIADQVGLALENARLFADTQRRAEQMATLHRVGLDITAALDLDGVLDALFDQIRRIVDAGSFYVALYDEDTGVIDFPLLTGVDGRIQIAPRHIDDEPGITGYVLKTGESLLIDDILALPSDVPYQIISVSENPTRSYLGVPLVFRDRVFGVVSVQSYRPDAYTEEDLELMTTIATQASTAIQNARAYERLVETAEQLREVDRLKTQFLANMSHELRTPLNSIIGFSRVMLKGIDGPVTELQEADLNSIYNSGQHLLGLINSILDMSKIEAGKMDLSFDEVPLADIFNTVLSTASALVKDRPVALRSEIPDDLPSVWADAQRVRQVLINLMSNATKFTEQGHITLRAEAGSEFVTISVSDTGVGIEPEAQQRLFIPFQQVDASTTRRAGGTGLGLAISRRFVEMQGGDIWVESEPGQGATFFFTLPVYEAVRLRQEDESQIDLVPGKKVILAIDDDQGVITLIKRYLEGDGYQVIGMTESVQALDTARRLAGDLTAITLDVVMPRMDGWQVLRALKSDPLTKEIPIILCSIVDGLEQGLGMGASVCLHKPVTRDEMVDALKKVEQEMANAQERGSAQQANDEGGS